LNDFVGLRHREAFSRLHLALPVRRAERPADRHEVDPVTDSQIEVPQRFAAKTGRRVQLDQREALAEINEIFQERVDELAGELLARFRFGRSD
jgi:hypothetical protein